MDGNETARSVPRVGPEECDYRGTRWAWRQAQAPPLYSSRTWPFADSFSLFYGCVCQVCEGLFIFLLILIEMLPALTSLCFNNSPLPSESYDPRCFWSSRGRSMAEYRRRHSLCIHTGDCDCLPACLPACLPGGRRMKGDARSFVLKRLRVRREVASS